MACSYFLRSGLRVSIGHGCHKAKFLIGVNRFSVPLDLSRIVLLQVGLPGTCALVEAECTIFLHIKQKVLVVDSCYSGDLLYCLVKGGGASMKQVIELTLVLTDMSTSKRLTGRL